MSKPIISIPDAIEVFVHGFSHGRSQTYPYVPTKIGNLWVMRDDPPRTKERKIEIITHGQSPGKAVEAIRNAEIGWHFLCEIHDPSLDFQKIRDEYKELGYRALGTEWLFAHDLKDIPIFESDPPVRQILDQEMLTSINQRPKQHRKIRPDTRLFSIWDDDRDYGWVTSVPYQNMAWVADLYVYESDRGNGYGRALMSKLLQTDRELGVKQSVLLASSDGARLYPHMGYQQIGILQMFCPTKQS